MLKFVAHQNIEHFRRLLDEVHEPKERLSIIRLLASEIDKLPADEQAAERKACRAMLDEIGHG